LAQENKKYKGFVLVELSVTLAILGVLLACLAISLYGFRKFNHYQLVRQRCVAAAQAQLDSIAVTGRQISPDDFARLWPKLSVSIEQSDGTGQWEGLKLVQVKTKAKSFSKDVEIELSRFILADGGNQK
jgi:prepilin-type N-terminal cleavage/methylation domain-containing protein